MLPYLDSRSGKKKQQTVSFGGLNLTQGAKEGELKNSKNLTSDQYPCLAVRRPHATYAEYNNPTALATWDGLIAVDGASLIYKGEVVGQVSEGEKQFAVVNTKICIFPDKKYLDLANKKFGYLEDSYTSPEGGVHSFGTNYVILAEYPIFASQQEPKHCTYSFGSSGGSFSRMDVLVKVYDSLSFDSDTKEWTGINEREMRFPNLAGGPSADGTIDENCVGKCIKLQKSSVSGAYAINTKRVMQTGENIDVTDYTEDNDEGFYAVITGFRGEIESSLGNYVIFYNYISYHVTRASEVNGRKLSEIFKVGDRVTITGGDIEGNRKELIKITHIDDEANKLTFDTTFTPGSSSSLLTVTRPVPDFDFVCESKNRLFGVCNKTQNMIWNAAKEEYETVESRVIYASALGDPTHFYDYDGLSTDSYAVAVASEGDFTGICPYSDDVLIWKENMLYKLMGDYPAEYALYAYNMAGVQKGCHKSMKIINEVLYYKGVEGVYAYAGNTPVLISYNLGLGGYSKAVAGQKESKYYISMQDKSGAWGLYVYDTLRRIWLKEADAHVIDFAYQDNVLYYLDADKKAVIAAESGSDEKVEWTAELVEFNEVVLNKKLYTKLFLRVEMAAGSTLKVEVAVDDGPFKQVFLTRAEGHKTFTMPIVPRRCDRFRVRLSGAGFCMVKSMLREYKAVSER